MRKKVKKGKKAKKNTGTSKEDVGDFRILPEAIIQSTGLDDRDKAKAVAKQIYSEEETNYWEVVVVTLDIRKSSIALVNLEDFEEYSNVITAYVGYVMETCQSEEYPCVVEPKDNQGKTIIVENGGWFDKFTGDGVIVFWRLPSEPYYEKKYHGLPPYEKKLERYYQKWNKAVRVAIEFSIKVTEQFLENAIPGIRKTCGLLPADFGMSVGIDAGECLLTELKVSEKCKEHYERYGLKYRQKMPAVSQNVTAIGRAIIGANRMVQKAKPYEIIVNSYPGSRLKEAMEDSKEKVGRGAKFSLERTIICTKEYNPVEAYRVVSGHLEHLKRTKTFCDRVKKTCEEKAKATSKQEDMEPDTNDSESQGDSE